mmetsp:Transcript_12633/g.24636  ORF Transcript_12633/g.24636 Transcript_12633/m.24636 type:complete len:537 (+) Transcript_12633:2-1612(+)
MDTTLVNLALKWMMLAALGFVLVSVSADLPREIEDGYYPGRSGDVIFMPSDLPDDSMMVLFGSDHLKSEQPQSLSINSVRDGISQAFGMAGTAAVSLVKDDVFHRPNLNFLVMVHGLGKDTVSKYNLHNIFALIGNNPTIKLEDISYPRNPLALSVTLVTGEKPAVHGLVADSWQEGGNKKHALTGENHAASANIADLMTQTYGDECLAISMSSSFAECHAHAPHKATRNTMSYYYDQEQKAFVSQNGSPSLQWSLLSTVQNIENSDLVELFSRIKLAGGDVVFNTRENSFLVKSGPSASPVRFHLDDKVDAALLAELFYAKTLVKKLATDTELQRKISDSTPDSVTLSFRSLNDIGEKYGYESKQYLAALKLFDSAIPVLTAKLGELSPSAHVGELVLMGSPVVLDKKAIADQINHLSLASDAGYLPTLFLEESIDSSHACQVLRMNLEVGSSGLRTFCPNSYIETVVTTLDASGSTATEDIVTIQQLKRWQIILWLSIAGFFTLLAGVIAFGCMEYERDTLLFSKRRIKEPSRS